MTISRAAFDAWIAVREPHAIQQATDVRTTSTSCSARLSVSFTLQVRADILGSIPALRRAQQEAQERELENKRVRDAEEALLPAWAGFQSEHNAGDGRRDDGLPQDMGLAPGGASHAQSGGLGGPPGGVTAKSMASEAARRADYRREMQQMIQEAARGDPDAARRRDAFYRALKMNKALDAATESALRVLELRAQVRWRHFWCVMPVCEPSLDLETKGVIWRTLLAVKGTSDASVMTVIKSNRSTAGAMRAR